MKLLLSCEHGGNEIPPQYAELFSGADDILNSHRGFDLGALDLFMYLCPLADFECYSKTSRLLVELNRSLHHPNLFSEYTSGLSKTKKDDLLNVFYHPYRNKVEDIIRNWLKEGERVTHISIHSFTPVLNGVERRADIGILYDPSRSEEKMLAKNWKQQLNSKTPQYKIRFNYPYKGTADGFTTYLRQIFKNNYMGIELEINQKFSNENIMAESLKIKIYNLLKEEIKRRQKV